MDNIVSAVSRLLTQCKGSEVEIEARIRKQLVNRESQALLLESLSCRTGKDIEWTTRTYTERRKISKSNRKCAYRQRIYGIGRSETICKSSIAREDLNDMWCTLNVSTEIQIPAMSRSLDDVVPTLVVVHRGKIDGHYVDIIHDRQEYRVEVEVCDARSFDPESTASVVRQVCAALQGSKYFIGYYDWFTVVHVTRLQFGPFCIDSGHYQRPRTMTMDLLLDVKSDIGSWVVTPKADGERRFIIAIDGRVFSVGLTRNVRFEGTSDNVGIYILDCEFTVPASSFAGVFPFAAVPVDQKQRKKGPKARGEGVALEGGMYRVFDTVVFENKYIGDTDDLYHRLRIAEDLCEKMKEDLRKRMCIKDHFPFGSFDALCRLYNEFRGIDGYRTDGIIFVSLARGYMQQVPKWKMDCTIDLMVFGEHKFGFDDSSLLEGTYISGEEISVSTCDGWRVDLPIGTAKPGLVMDKASDVFPEQKTVGKQVWEFSYDRDLRILFPIRRRHDRPQANSRKVVEINMFRAVPGNLFSGVGCYMMRKYHNRVKGELIKGANDDNAVILDIGTGQGGDVGKWNRAAAVYCIEPSAASTREMVCRYGDIENIRVLNCYLRDLDTSLIDRKIDIFTAFFCMNQFQDNDWKMLQKTIARKGSSRCRLLAIAMTAPRSHKGECFDIAENNGRYNVKIHQTRIFDIEETAVLPGALTKMMNKCGLKLAKQYRLDGDDFMTQEERLLSSMYEVLIYNKARK